MYSRVYPLYEFQNSEIEENKQNKCYIKADLVINISNIETTNTNNCSFNNNIDDIV